MIVIDAVGKIAFIAVDAVESCWIGPEKIILRTRSAEEWIFSQEEFDLREMEKVMRAALTYSGNGMTFYIKRKEQPDGDA